MSKLVKRLETEGKIRKQKAGFVQVEALLKEAILDLKEAEKVLYLVIPSNDCLLGLHKNIFLPSLTNGVPLPLFKKATIKLP